MNDGNCNNDFMDMVKEIISLVELEKAIEEFERGEFVEHELLDLTEKETDLIKNPDCLRDPGF